jgi:metal-sulfur cluster biosynthetic enzyme
VNEITPPTAWTPDGEKPMQQPPEPSAAPASGLPSEDALIEAIATVYDPEIPVNIYELGLIYAIEIADDGAVKVEMTLTAPGCPSAQELPEQVRDAVLMVDGVTS